MINKSGPLGIILLRMVHEFAGGVVTGCHSLLVEVLHRYRVRTVSFPKAIITRLIIFLHGCIDTRGPYYVQVLSIV